MPNRIVQNLRAAAWNRIEARVAKPRNGVAQAEPADIRDIRDLGRGEAMQMNREPLLDRAEKILVPLDLEVRMQSALHQHAGAAQIERLLNLFEDRFLGKDVAFVMPHRPIEGAEAAIFRAEVRVVDVAIDDVGDDALGMPLAADGVGLHTDPYKIRGIEEIERFFAGNHLA